jgi:hypothetical protein
MTAESGDFRDVLNKANQQLTKINSYHMTMELTGYCTIDGKDAYFVASGETEPAQADADEKRDHRDCGCRRRRNETTFTQYTEEAGDKLSVYTHTDGKWYRQVMASRSSLPIARKSYAKTSTSSPRCRQSNAGAETDEALFLDVTVNLGALLAGSARFWLYRRK